MRQEGGHKPNRWEHLGRLFKKTTEFFSAPPTAADRLKGVRTACPLANGSKVLNIRIFDEHGLVTDMDTNGADLATDLGTFFSGLGDLPGVDAAVKARLSTFTFNVTYTQGFPTGNEIKGFAANDFPVYLKTVTGTVGTSGKKIVDLFIEHKIPLKTHVKMLVPDPDIPPPQVRHDIKIVKPYDDLEKDWDEIHSILGIGVGGDYFEAGSQHKCRKIGLIKMGGFMKLNIVPEFWRPKLLSVMKHEIGHMLGLSHDHPDAQSTLMAKNYDTNFGFANYEKHHVLFITDALESLTKLGP